MHRISLGALALMLSAAPAAAQGWIEVAPSRVPSQNNPNVVRVASDVRTTIEGRVVRVEVEERFRNAGGGLAEGSYLYPLPGEAVFQNFSLWMGEQEIRGEMMNVEQARGIYEEIVRRKRDPALLTLAGHGLVRAQVFPIQPGETRKVVLRYTQLLDRTGDALRIRYPLGARGGSAGTWRLTIPDAAAYGVPYSPTHSLTSRRTDGTTGDHHRHPRGGRYRPAAPAAPRPGGDHRPDQRPWRRGGLCHDPARSSDDGGGPGDAA